MIGYRYPANILSLASPFIVWSGLHASGSAPPATFPSNPRKVLHLARPEVYWNSNFKFGLQPPPPPSGKTLREAVVAFLGSIPGIQTLVGPRIYFADPSQLSIYPCIVVQVTAREYGRNLAGADGTSIGTVHIEAISQFESVSIACVEAWRNFMDGFRGTQSGVAIMTCHLEDELDAQTPPLAGSNLWIYHVATEYRVKHRVPVPVSVTQTNV